MNEEYPVYEGQPPEDPSHQTWRPGQEPGKGLGKILEGGQKGEGQGKESGAQPYQPPKNSENGVGK